MDRRQIRDLRLMIQVAIWIFFLILAVVSHQWVNALIILFIHPVLCCGLIYFVTDGQVRMWEDAREWWEDVKNPPKYPFA